MEGHLFRFYILNAFFSKNFNIYTITVVILHFDYILDCL